LTVAVVMPDDEEGRTPDADAIAKFFAKRVKKSSTRGAVNEAKLASRIAEIELETQILGASFIKVQIIDPEWVLQTSGFIDVKEGLLDEIEVEFPEGTGYMWVLCAVEGSTEVANANLTLTFEDKVVAELRQYWGPKVAPPGTQTRAEFVQDLVAEVGTHGEPKLRFRCPSLKTVQPVEEETKGELGTLVVSSAIQSGNAKAKANKERGVGAGSSITVKGQAPNAQQLSDINTALSVANQKAAPLAATEALIVAGIAESDFKRDAVEEEGQHNHFGIWQSSSIPGDQVAQQAAGFLDGGVGGFQGGGAIALAKAGLKPIEIAAKVEAGPPASFYTPYLAEAKAIVQAGGGVKLGGTETGATAESDVGQLTRGTADNPDEDSFEAINRLAQQVNWFAFSDGTTFFYMDGPDFAAQKPSLYLDVPRDHVIDSATGRSEYGVILSPTTYTFDNTTFEYRLSHKTKTKAQRRSRPAKPSTPSEVRLSLMCDIDAYRAGECFVFQNSGPIDGRWIVTDATRNCLKDTFTTFILEPPSEPLPEPKATEKGEELVGGVGNSSIAGAAKKALSERGLYAYSEGSNRGNNGTLYGPKWRTMDCSSFCTLCYKAAGAPDPSGLNYSPIGDTASMIKNMTKVSTPKPGACCFFGPSVSETIHVTLYVGGGRAIAMQAPGITLGEGPAETFGPGNFLGYWELPS
jgi:NlpC/P60 family